MSSGLPTISAAVRSETAAFSAVERRVAVLLERQRDHVEAGGRGGGRVARVRLDRRDHLAALLELAARLRGRRGSRRRGCRPRRRRRRPGRRTGPCPDSSRRIRSSRWTISSTPCSVSSGPGSGCSSAICGRATSCSRDARVVLHRAGAEQADADHAERLLREVQVVAQHVVLGQLGQVGRRRAAHALRHQARRRRRRRSGRGDDRAAPAGRAELHHQRLVPARRRGKFVPSSRHLRERRGEALDVVGRVHLGDAVERALAEPGQVGGEVLAAEDAVLEQRRG